MAEDGIKPYHQMTPGELLAEDARLAGKVAAGQRTIMVVRARLSNIEKQRARLTPFLERLQRRTG